MIGNRTSRALALAAALISAPALAEDRPIAFIAPTAPVSDNGNRIATTAWVNNYVAAGLPLAAGKIWIGNASNIAAAQTPSGDWTISQAGVATLATVNANVGAFGSVTQCITLTANGKGLITAASAATCTPAVGSITGLGANVAAWLATPSSANLRAALTDESGTGAAYFQGGDLGTPSAGVLTSATGLPISTGVSGLAAGVATFLATPSSANLRAAITDETGAGASVFADTPSLITPILGVASATSINKVAITAPATAATLTIANNKTATVSSTLTFSGTDGSTLNVGAGGTLAAVATSGSASDLSTGTLPSARFAPIAPVECMIISTAAATCDNGTSPANNGTYTTPVSGGITAKYLEVELCGGGGGAQGGGSGSPGNGTTGGNTTFSTLTGSGGVNGGAGGAGGAAAGGSNIAGTTGNGTPSGSVGGFGGAGPFGGSGQGGEPTAGTGLNATNKCSGGGGGGGTVGASGGGTGGGAGGNVKAILSSPAATLSYAVGAAGAGGAAGTGGGAGGNGVIGYIRVIAKWQ